MVLAALNYLKFTTVYHIFDGRQLVIFVCCVLSLCCRRCCCCCRRRCRRRRRRQLRRLGHRHTSSCRYTLPRVTVHGTVNDVSSVHRSQRAQTGQQTTESTLRAQTRKAVPVFSTSFVCCCASVQRSRRCISSLDSTSVFSTQTRQMSAATTLGRIGDVV